MGGFGRGLAFLKDQQDKMGSRYGDRMQKLWLKNGESARFVFIQDHDEIAVPLVHMVEALRRDGSKYNKDVLCARRSISEDPNVCTVCLTTGSKGPWPRYVAVVWVDLIVHPTRKEGSNWSPVKLPGGTETFYKEEVRDFRLLIMREKLTSQIQTYLAGDPLDPGVGAPTSILPVWWRYRVTGESTSKVELLENGAKLTDEDKGAIEARKSAPVLEEVITSEFGNSPKATMAGGSGQSSELVEYSAEEEAAAAMSEGATDSEDITF